MISCLEPFTRLSSSEKAKSQNEITKRNHQNEMQTKSLDKLFLFFFSYFFLVELVDPVEIYNLNLDYFNFHNVKHLTLWLWRCLCWSKHKRNVRWVSLDFKPIFCYFYFNFHFCLNIICAKHSQPIRIHWWIEKSTFGLRKALLDWEKHFWIEKNTFSLRKIVFNVILN